MTSQAHCELCMEFAGHGSMRLARAPLAPASRTLYRSADFVVVPTIGPIVVGHVLICPVQHRRSIAVALAEGDTGFASALRNVQVSLQQLAPRLPAFLFEHGMSADGSERCGACMDHAHLHIVPAQECMKRVRSELDGWKQVTWDTLPSAVGLGGYLLMAELGGGLLVRPGPAFVPSQYFRRIVAAAHDVAEWNWRVDPAWGNLRETVDRWPRNP